MAKHKKPNPYARNNKETSRDEQVDNSQQSTDARPYSRYDQASIMVSLVEDAFASLGVKTKVADYRAKRFDNDGKFNGTVRGISVVPVNDQGFTTGPSVNGSEESWAQRYVAIKEKFSDRADAVKHLAESDQLRKLIA